MTIKLASFFTGGGFLDMGFELAGFDVAWSNEFNADICDMHDHAYTAWRRSFVPDAPEARISFRGSIEDVNLKDIPPIDGIIGGPPCPAWSIAGKQGGSEDPRGRLSRSYIDAILGIRPKFFLMENVPNLARSKKHSKYLRGLRNLLRDAGYLTDVRILNALEHGAPQDRERMFMVGFRDDVLKEVPRMPFGTLEEGWFPFPEPTWPDAKDAFPWPDKSPFGGAPEAPCVPCELTIDPLMRNLEGVANADEAFYPYSKMFKIVEEGDVHRKSYKRPHRFRYAPTAAYGNNEVPFHPWLPRRMSVRECLRIQTVSDDYVLPADKSLSIKFKLIGNGVTVLLALAMASSIRRFIESSCRNHESWNPTTKTQ